MASSAACRTLVDCMGPSGGGQRRRNLAPRFCVSASVTMQHTLRVYAALALAALLLAVVAVSADQRGGIRGLSGTLIVTNKAPSTATIVDVESGRVLATLPTGQGPHEIALSQDGRRAVITDYGARRTLTVIDVPNLKVERTIDLGDYRSPHGIAFLPGDRRVAVTTESSRHVVIVDVVDGRVAAAIPTEASGSHMVGVTADGRRAFTGNMGAGTVSELDLERVRLVRSYPVPATPEAVNVTPDGAEVWVGSNATGRVSVLQPASGTVETAVEGLRWPYRMFFTPDLALVVVPDPSAHEVRFVDRKSRRELSRLSFAGAAPQGVTATPDGRFLFQSLSAQGRVAVIEVSSRAVVGYLSVGDTPDGLAYSRLVHAAGE